MTASRVIAIDLGASSGRVVLADGSTGVVRIEAMHRFSNAPVRRTVGGVSRWCWDLDAILEGILAGLTRLSGFGPVESIAVDSWAVDYGLIDAEGGLVSPVTSYRDDRHVAAYERLRREIGVAEIYAQTGIQFQPFNTLYQLATDAADPERPLQRAARMLMIPDLVAHRLCGATVGERTNAGSTQCFDSERNAWIDELLTRADIPREIMPSVVSGEAHGPIGELRPALAEGVGLPGGTSVRATASHDTAAAVAAAPIVGPDDCFLSSGTWSLVGFELDGMVRTPEAMAINATNEPGVFQTNRFLRNVSGLWLLQECRRAWKEAGRDLDWETLESMAREATPFRTVFDPDDPSLGQPGDMPERILGLIRTSGEPLPEDDGGLVRAILDSVALATAQAIRSLAAVSGRTPQRIVLVGGGGENGLLVGLVSACAGLPVVVGESEATALGNAAVQLAAANGITTRSGLSALLPAPRASADPDEIPGVAPLVPEAMERLARLK